MKTSYFRVVGLVAAGMAMSQMPCHAQSYTISTYAGGGHLLPSTTPQPATNVQFLPLGVATDAAANVYATSKNIVAKITPEGMITLIAGGGGTGFSGDGGDATKAQFSFGGDVNLPPGIAVDAAGNVFVSDTGNYRVRKISTSGIVTTVAGGGTFSIARTGDGGPATAAGLLAPSGLAIDAGGNLYIADAGLVRKVDPGGTISTVAGCLGITAACLQNGQSASLGDGGPATDAVLGPVGVAVDNSGNLLIADLAHNRIRKVSTSGIITTIAGSAAASFQGDGGPATSAGLYQPNAVAIDSAGNVYIDDAGDYRIRKVATNGTITTIAGNGSAAQPLSTPPNNLPAAATSLSQSSGIALGSGGRIFIADGGIGVRVLALPGAEAPPSIQSGGVVSAGAFGQFSSVAPGSWIEIYGSNLASTSRSWSSADFDGVHAPTQLDGTTVTIGAQQAFIDYISPMQVNAQVPSNTPLGTQPVVVNTAKGVSAPSSININSVQPGLLSPSSFNVGAKQYAAALFSDGATYVLPTGAIPGLASRPARPGDSITLYGIGFGAVIPGIPAGEIVQQANTLAASLQVLIGGLPTLVTYDGLAPNAVGLYQFNLVVPNVPSTGAVPLTFVVGSTADAQILYLALSAQ